MKGTVKPTNMPYTNWTNLNPCPLNACCDIWGICGVTSEFCTNSTAETGSVNRSQVPLHYLELNLITMQGSWNGQEWNQRMYLELWH